MSWKQWLAGDAAPSAAAKALHPRMPRTYEPNFTPKPKTHGKKSHKHKSHKHGSGSTSSTW
jgi:hypothetical protein